MDVVPLCANSAHVEGGDRAVEPLELQFADRGRVGQLFDRGICHTVEVWENKTLVGGLYGLSIGAAFFGESMFHRRTDASKIALVHLVARLRAGNYQLLDTQFVTDHLRSFGGIEIPREDYELRLARALEHRGDFHAFDRAGR